MNYQNTALRIEALSVQNYRKFDSYDIAFDQKLTVLVGDNGAGKSTLIDAASIALGSLFQGLEYAKEPSVTPNDARISVIQQGDMADYQSQFPVTISATGIVDDREMKWSRLLTGSKTRMTKADALNIIEAGKHLNDAISNNGNTIILPILARYETNRLWKSGSKSPDTTPSRAQGYDDALQAASNESRMNAWLKRQSIWEWQNKRESSLFTAVKKALASCFDAAMSTTDAVVEFDAELQQLVFAYRDTRGIYHRDRLSSMSDGYRGTLSLIADIAYRMSTLNPALGAHILETPGVVMIDEVDLHLHPRWQARILGDLATIFPNVQFITTTHSPIVIASAPKNCIRILGETAATIPAIETKGRDAGIILNTVLGVSSRPENITKLFKSFNAAIDSENYADAKTILDNIEELIGTDDPDVIAAKTTLELEELLS